MKAKEIVATLDKAWQGAQSADHAAGLDELDRLVVDDINAMIAQIKSRHIEAPAAVARLLREYNTKWRSVVTTMYQRHPCFVFKDDLFVMHFLSITGVDDDKIEGMVEEVMNHRSPSKIPPWRAAMTGGSMLGLLR